MKTKTTHPYLGKRVTLTQEFTTKEWSDMGYEKANALLEPINPLVRLEILQNAPSSMTPYEEWIRRSKAEIIQWYMNALKTCSCGGHGKGERNEQAVKEYKVLMEKYSIPVPSSEISYILGIFNGEGSC